MKLIPALIFSVVLAAPASSQYARPETQLDVGLGRAYGPQVSAHNGTAVAMWKEDGTNHIWCSNSRDMGLNWLPPIRVDDDTSGASKYASNRSFDIQNDHVSAVWEDQRTGSEEVFFAHSHDGGETWGANIQLPVSGHARIFGQKVSALGSDVFVAVEIEDAVTLDEGVFMCVSRDRGATWTGSRLDPGLGDVDGFDLRSVDQHVYVTYADDRSGANAAFAQISFDKGNTFTEVALPSVNKVGANSVKVWAEAGDVLFGWLEDMASSKEDVMACWSYDYGATLGAAVNMTGHMGAADCDNLELYHSQINPGTGGMTNMVFEDNRSGSDEVVCVSTPDYGVNKYENNLGTGTYPRVLGGANYVAVAFGGGGFPENPNFVMSRNGGMDFSPLLDASNGASTGDADYIEIGFDSDYNSFYVASVEDRTGTNQMYVGGARSAQVAVTADPTTGIAEIDLSGYGISEGGFQVQIAAARTLQMWGSLTNTIPDGRVLLLEADTMFSATKSMPSLRLTVGADGTATTGPIPYPVGLGSLYLTAVSFTTGPSGLVLGSIAESIGPILF